MRSRKFQIKVKPGAKKNEVIGWRDGVLHARVKAPPVEGAANREAVKLLARYFGVTPSSVEITGGHKSRYKRVVITTERELSVPASEEEL